MFEPNRILVLEPKHPFTTAFGYSARGGTMQGGVGCVGQQPEGVTRLIYPGGELASLGDVILFVKMLPLEERVTYCLHPGMSLIIDHRRQADRHIDSYIEGPMFLGDSMRPPHHAHNVFIMYDKLLCRAKVGTLGEMGEPDILAYFRRSFRTFSTPIDSNTNKFSKKSADLVFLTNFPKSRQ